MSSVATIIVGTKRIAIPALETCPVASEGSVSPQALALYRILVGLSRRAGYACVKLLETLAQYHRAALSTTRGHLAELVAAGWIGRKQTRKGGVSKLFFWPLVRVAKRSRGLFAPGQPAFFAPKSGVCSGGYSPSNLAVTPSTPYKKTPVGKRDDNTQTATPTKPEADPVAVSLLENVVSSHEAQDLAREAKTQGLSKEQLQRVLEAYRGQVDNIRNRGAWLRRAIQRSYQPAAPAATHPSEVNPIENVKRTKQAVELPTVRPGAELLAASRVPALARILSKRKAEAS